MADDKPLVPQRFVPQFGPNGAVMNAPEMTDLTRDLYESAEQEQAKRDRPRREDVRGARIRKPGFIHAIEWGHAGIPVTVWAVAAYRLIFRHAFPPSFGSVDWTFAISFMVQAWLFFTANGIWTRFAIRRAVEPPTGLTRAPADAFWVVAIWSSVTWPTLFSVPILFWTVPEEMREPDQLATGLFFALMMLTIEACLRIWVWRKKWFVP
ncbi:MAG: hypothetical protein ABI740_09005 [Alphaproteobacteria bacterium]